MTVEEYLQQVLSILQFFMVLSVLFVCVFGMSSALVYKGIWDCFLLLLHSIFILRTEGCIS